MNAPARRFVPSVVATASARREDDHALWFAFCGDELLLAEHAAPGDAGAKPALRAPVAREISAVAGVAAVRQQYLGTLDGRGCYAAELPAGTQAPPGYRLLSLRRVFDRLDPAEYEVAGTAFQVQYWDRGYQFCPACATPLVPRATERAKRCPKCAHDYFPRVAPAMIVLVHDGPRVLLTRQPRFPPGMYGLVAGFLEPGETLEACVAREVREETGLEIAAPVYFGSQPWPFPHQIMVGFTAAYAGGELVVDTSELEEARWFDLAALPALPPRISIARAILDAWLAAHPTA